MAELQQQATAALQATKEYMSQSTKLSQKVTALNDVYGNMLSALSIKS
jgi:hypothetical protein